MARSLSELHSNLQAVFSRARPTDQVDIGSRYVQKSHTSPTWVVARLSAYSETMPRHAILHREDDRAVEKALSIDALATSGEFQLQ